MTISEKNPKREKLGTLFSILITVGIFIYFYTLYKSISIRYITHCGIFSFAAFLLVKSYVKDPLEWNKSILIAFVIALIARTFIVQAFKIPTGSMEPTLHGDPLYGDRVLVNKFMYHFRKPERGDIVVFRTVNIPGLDGQKDFIKRLAALSGEEIEIRNGRLIINDEKVSTPEIFAHINYLNTKRFMRGPFDEGQYGLSYNPIQVPARNYFVLGDNSPVSRDSRFWGYVPEENLMGQAFMTYWPLKRLKLLKSK